ncbi:MAG: FtsX-like permease family protein [Chitinivibrionia bacterium]|nr:FtsX-like permease family protein [Chitinivibrionia bacterium]
MSLLNILENNSAFIKIALRNLARHKVKTGLTSAAIMVSVAMFVFLSSWLSAISVESRRNIVNYDMSAAKLQTKMYFERRDERPSYENFTDWQRFSAALYAEGFYSAPRFVFSGMIHSNFGSAPMLVNAIDVEAEARILHYMNFVDFGRMPESGSFEIAVGTMAAGRLRVGIPTRPRRSELEELIAQSATNEADKTFIRSLYEEERSVNMEFFAASERQIVGNERVFLRRNISREDIDRLWNMIAQTDRNNVRINAVIDIRALPEMIRRHLWEGELMPALREKDISKIEAAYEFEEALNAFILKEELDEYQKNEALTIMIRSGFRGAVRHVNQLIDAVVVGVINSPDPVPNGNIAYIPLDVLQDEAGMMLDGAITELLIRKKGVAYTQLPNADESAAAITTALKRGLAEPLPDHLGVFFWKEYMSEYLAFEALEMNATKALSFLLLFLACLVISNTILLAVLERTKEIGMTRSMGMTDGQVIAVYMIEAGFLGLLGSALGIILGCAINYPMVKYGLDISAMAETLGGGIGFRVSTVLRSGWDIPVLFQAGIGATILAALMAYFPTKRALKMSITDSLRFE